MKRQILSLLAVAVLALAGIAMPESASAQTTCSVTGTQGVAPAATLSWVAPITNTDGSPVATPLTFDVLQSTTPGAEVVVQSGVVGGTVTISNGLSDGTTYYYKVRVKDAKGTPSALSNEGCITFPVGVPMAVTITVTPGP